MLTSAVTLGLLSNLGKQEEEKKGEDSVIPVANLTCLEC